MENRVKKTSWVDIYKKIGIYVILVAVFLFFSIVTPQFRSPANIINIIRQVSMFGIVVIGVTIVMLGGGMDLSVGGQMAVDGMIAGILMVNLKVPFGLAIVIVLLVGVAFGFINGIVTITFNIPPIIVTLGTMLVLNGVAYIVTGGLPVNGMPEGFKVLGQGYIGVVPVPVIILGICKAVQYQKTAGRHVLLCRVCSCDCFPDPDIQDKLFAAQRRCGLSV